MILITKRENKLLTCLLQDNRLISVQAENDSLIGNIYVGKVKNVVPKLQSAFVEIQKGVMCYLPVPRPELLQVLNREPNGKLAAGDELLVQVSTDRIKTKDATATAVISLSGKYITLSNAKRVNTASRKLSEASKAALMEWAEPYFSEQFSYVIRTNAGELLTVQTDEQRSSFIREIEQLTNQLETILAAAKSRVPFSCLYKAPAGFLAFIQNMASDSYSRIITDAEDVHEQAKDFLTLYKPEDLPKLSLYQDSMVSLSAIYSLESKLQEALGKRVWLKSGGYLVIEPTEALTVIDVNTGKATGGKPARSRSAGSSITTVQTVSNQAVLNKNSSRTSGTINEDTFFRMNQEAVAEIVHQIRLRNLSGIILVDFINMKEPQHKKILLQELKEQCQKDPVPTAVIDMTPLGLVEITRKKVKASLWEQLITINKKVKE